MWTKITFPFLHSILLFLGFLKFLHLDDLLATEHFWKPHYVIRKFSFSQPSSLLSNLDWVLPRSAAWLASKILLYRLNNLCLLFSRFSLFLFFASLLSIFHLPVSPKKYFLTIFESLNVWWCLSQPSYSTNNLARFQILGKTKHFPRILQVFYIIFSFQCCCWYI